VHEASLAEGLLKLVCESVRSHNAEHPDQPAGRVASLKLGLGLLSCVEIETFKGCFSLLAEGTEAEGAKLDIELTPLPCSCEDCGARFTLTRRRFVCSQCGGVSLSAKGGHELVLLSLEAEQKDNQDA